MTNLIPLPIYPNKPTGAELEMIKQAKAMVDTDILVQPVRAVQGSPGRVIALRERPHWICDYAYIPNPNVNSLKEAIEWALEIKEDPRGVTVLRTLKEIFGEGTREL
jgi:Asp-tRNA(Asn)/Glu-tRNA(Gln) amidotransferase B subunit